jgi:glycosyltransferase involved in cell wall biosynthesis
MALLTPQEPEQQPYFTIILPTHNRSSLVQNAINSVLRQTYHDFQLIIVDDGSTDDTRKIISAITDSRVIRIFQQQGGGVSAARNKGIEAAQGRYISFLDDDDEYLPNFLEETRNFILSATTPMQFTWSGIRVNIQKNDGAIETNDRVWQVNFDTPAAQEKAYLAATEIACCFGVTIERQRLSSCGGFDESLKISEDTDLFLRLLANNIGFGAIPKVLVLQNVHQGQSLSRSISPSEKAKYNQLFIWKNIGYLQQHPLILNRYQTSLAGTYYEGGYRTEARKVIREVLSRNPFYTKAWELFLRFEIIKRFKRKWTLK